MSEKAATAASEATAAIGAPVGAPAAIGGPVAIGAREAFVIREAGSAVAVMPEFPALIGVTGVMCRS